MRLLLPIIYLMVCLTMHAESGTQRLRGVWKSNRELTLATFKNLPPMNAERRARFEGIFGKLTITYESARLCSRLPDEASEPIWQEYKVVIEHGDVVWIESYDSIQKAKIRIQITFEGENRYWIHLDESKGTKEYFDRVR